jgi:mannose-6-phosphate isomerase-like protein (cupin superfamily)
MIRRNLFSMKAVRKSFIIKELKAVELSGWGAEYGAIEKVFFDAKTPTVHSSTGITICTGGEKSKIPMHYHNCETSHYVLYGNGVMKSADGSNHVIKPGDAIYCGSGPEGAHNFENVDEFPLAILWVHAYPKGTSEDTVWLAKE